MPRRTIDNQNFTAGNKTTLRRAEGVRTTTQLLNRARNAGINLGRRRDTQERRAFDWARDRYNTDVLAEQERTARDRQRRQNQARQNRRIRDRVTRTPSSETGVYEFLRNNYGRRVGLRFIDTDEDGSNVIRNTTYNVPNAENFNRFWQRVRWDWIFDTDEDLFDRHPDAVLYTYLPNRIITTERIVQAFADGITNCLLTPMLLWFENQREEVTSQTSKKRYASLITKTLKLMEEYPVSVPEADLQTIADTLQIRIEIEFPIPKVAPFIEVESSKKFLRTFRFINTRIDHLDIQRIVSDEPTVVSREEMEQIVADDDGLLHYNKNNLGICAVYTLDTKYVLEDEYSEAVKFFEFKTGLDLCKIDHIAEPKLSNFIQQGVHYNGTVDYEPVWNVSNSYDFNDYDDIILNTPDEYVLRDEHEVKHIDMEKAYTQFKASRYYCGFMHSVHHFRETDKVQGIGMWVINDIDYSGVDDNTRQHLEQMQVFNDDQIYTNPDLAFLDDVGARYRVVAGAWSVNPINFDFSDVMINTKYEVGEDKVPYYSKWTGGCNHISTEKRIFLRGGEEYYRAIKQTGVECHFFPTGEHGRENDEILVTYPKNKMLHLSQITAYITAYTRLNLLEQLCRMDYNSIVRVCVDGIYYRPLKFDKLNFDVENLIHDFCGPVLGNGFRVKDDKTFANRQCGRYTLGYYDGNFEGSTIKRDGVYQTEAHIGEGGGGKTHNNMVDDGLQRVLYIAPSWKLARKKKEEYDIDVTVWAKLLNDPDTKRIYMRKYNVFIIDECSQMTEGTKASIIKDFPHTMLIFCGDLGFQLPPCVGDEMNAGGMGRVVNYTTNYRCVCHKLKSLLKEVRVSIARRDSGRSICDRVYEVIKFRKIPFTYDVPDMILSSTHKGKDNFTARYGTTESLKKEIQKLQRQKKRDPNEENRLKVYMDTVNAPRSNTITDKWFVRSVGKDYSTGEIVVGEKPTGVISHLQHAYTVHSIQGETAYDKLIIDTKGMKNDARMLYTALSRAKKLNQIYLV